MRSLRWVLGLVAFLVTAASVALAVLLALLPEVSSLSYVEVASDGPRAASGDLVVLEEVVPTDLAVGDFVTGGDLAGDGLLYRVTELAGENGLVSAAATDPPIAIPLVSIEARVWRALGGFGEAYTFVASDRGWALVGAASFLTWALYAASLLLQRSSRAAPDGSKTRDRERPEPLLDRLVARPAPQRDAETISPAAWRSAPLAARGVAGVQHLQAIASGEANLPFPRDAADLQRLASAPQARWAGAVALTAAVAAAVFVAAETQQRRSRERDRRSRAAHRGGWFR